jgi:hypothetical protein
MIRANMNSIPDIDEYVIASLEEIRDTQLIGVINQIITNIQFNMMLGMKNYTYPTWVDQTIYKVPQGAAESGRSRERRRVTMASLEKARKQREEQARRTATGATLASETAVASTKRKEEPSATSDDGRGADEEAEEKARREAIGDVRETAAASTKREEEPAATSRGSDLGEDLGFDIF